MFTKSDTLRIIFFCESAKFNQQIFKKIDDTKISQTKWKIATDETKNYVYKYPNFMYFSSTSKKN